MESFLLLSIIDTDTTKLNVFSIILTCNLLTSTSVFLLSVAILSNLYLLEFSTILCFHKDYMVQNSHNLRLILHMNKVELVLCIKCSFIISNIFILYYLYNSELGMVWLICIKVILHFLFYLFCCRK